MKKLKANIFSGFLGVSSGLAGLVSITRCGGGCASCFGCAGTGLVLLLIALSRKITGEREKKDGMA